MSLVNAIKSAYPSAVVAPDGDVIVTSDQNGERIERWGLAEPRPDESELLAAYDPLPAAQAHKLAAIRAEAKQRIEARYPDWLQRNMTARSAELIDIRATVGSLTAEEEAERQGIKAIWTAIKSVRAASNAAEAQVTAADTVEVVEAVTVDWPTL